MRKLVLTFSSMVGAPIPFSAFAAALKVALSASVDSRPHDGAYLMNPRRVTSWSGGARPGLSQKGGLPSRRGADCGPRPSTRAPRGSDCCPCAVLRGTRAGATLSLAALFLPGPGSGDSNPMADRFYALEKLTDAVDALATGAGRVQERLGHGYLQPVTCSRLTTQPGAGGVRTV